MTAVKCRRRGSENIRKNGGTPTDSLQSGMSEFGRKNAFFQPGRGFSQNQHPKF